MSDEEFAAARQPQSWMGAIPLLLHLLQALLRLVQLPLHTSFGLLSCLELLLPCIQLLLKLLKLELQHHTCRIKISIKEWEIFAADIFSNQMQQIECISSSVCILLGHLQEPELTR